MSNFNVVDLQQGTQPWLDWRSQGITATDIPTILGLNPYKTAYSLWLEKTGRANPPDLRGNPNVERGNRLEPIARQVLEETHDEVLLPACVEYSAWPTLRASLDGLSTEDIPYEIKAPTEKKFDELTNDGTDSPTYRLYDAQVVAQCVTVGAERGVLFFYLEDGRSLTFEIQVDNEDIDTVLNAARSFWECIETDTPPELDPNRDLFIPESGDEEFRWRLHSKEWNQRTARIKELEAELKLEKSLRSESQEALTAMMGNYRTTDYAGIKVTQFTKQGSIDHAAYHAAKGTDPAELENFRRAATTETRFTASKENKVLNADEIGNEAIQAPKKRGAIF